MFGLRLWAETRQVPMFFATQRLLLALNRLNKALTAGSAMLLNIAEKEIHASLKIWLWSGLECAVACSQGLSRVIT